MATTLGSPGVTFPDGTTQTTAAAATTQYVKAWVNFNGTGTVAIRASMNVSSITDGGTGKYTVNFTSALADGNYTTVITGKLADSSATTNNFLMAGSYSQTTTGCPIVFGRPGDGQNDPAICCVAIFR